MAVAPCGTDGGWLRSNFVAPYFAGVAVDMAEFVGIHDGHAAKLLVLVFLARLRNGDLVAARLELDGAESRQR